MANRGVTVNVKPITIPKGQSHLSQTFFFDIFSVKYLMRKHADKLCANGEWLRWNADKLKLDIPQKSLERCLRSGKRFVFQTMEVTSKVGNGHANALLIDTQPPDSIYYTKGTKEAKRLTSKSNSPRGLPKYARVYRFDPQGAAALEFFKDYRYEALDRKLNDYFGKLNWTYESPELWCPYVSVQHFEEGERRGMSGYCASFSVYFVDMQLTYENMSKAELAYQINLKMRQLKTQKKFESYILSYVQQIYNIAYELYPQYSHLFLNYDRLSARPTKEFKEFEKFLHTLLVTDNYATTMN